MEIANELITEIVDKKVASLNSTHLPVSGNLDADVIREVCTKHGVDHTTPPAAKGGSALVTVKTKRNALSYGDESFVECGRSLAAADLVRAKDEIVLFLRSILQNLEQFAVNKSYKL